MKKRKILKISNFQDKKLEKEVSETIAELDNLAYETGKILSDRELPKPVGDRLESYIGEIKAGYEKLCANVYKKLQPASHFPEVNTDLNNVNADKENALEEIKQLNKQIDNLNSEISKLSIDKIYYKIREIRIKTILIYIAEVFLNTLSFQALGENLLFSFLISIPFTYAISEFAHLTASKYKKIENVIKRRLFLLSAFFIATVVFSGTAYFRSVELEQDGFSFGTLCFIIINMFIFLVACFIHFMYSMSKEEKIKYNAYKKYLNEIKLRKAEISKIEESICELDEELNEKQIIAIQIKQYTEDTIKEIRKAYSRSVEIFKQTNIRLRSDKNVPDCFLGPTPDLEIDNDNDFNNNKNKEE